MTDTTITKPIPGTQAWKEHWAGQIAEAQKQPTVVIAGDTYQRIPYGKDHPAGRARCRDCGVEFGQYHVENCCVERCARCHTGQALGCPCGAGH